MTGPTLVVFVGVLVALLLGMLALLVWQEGRKREFDTGPEYVVDEVLAFVRARMTEAAMRRLGEDGLERIINWELRYLQRDGGPAAVAGGTAESIAYIVEQLSRVDGIAVDPGDVEEVLALEADYLHAIGAVGSPLDDGG